VLRGEEDPSRASDVSNNNRMSGNCMSAAPGGLDPQEIDFSVCDGLQDLNGLDFWWDDQEGTDCLEVDQDPGSCVDAADGLGNCWTANSAPANVTSDPELIQTIAACPGIDVARPPDASKSAFLVPCTMWDPQTNTDPAGCEMAGTSWFDVPPEP